MTTTLAPTPNRTRSWIEPAAATWSALAAAVGAIWLLAPGSYPDQLLDREANGSLLALVDPTAISALTLLLGLGGVLVASAPASPRRLVAVVGAGYAGVFGLLATDMSLLVAMGYSAAILGPPALLGLLVAWSVRHPPLRWVVGGLLATGALAGAGFGLDRQSAEEFFTGLGEGLARGGLGMLVVAFSFVGGALWLLVALRAADVAGGSRAHALPARSGATTRRDWGWWMTVLAAAGPLPYALTRMTWLTPWPFWMTASQLEASPATRMFGLSLGFAALGGSVLTLGLLMRWGSVYPRWIPTLGGRPASPTWPTAFAVVVGVAVTVAGRSMLQVALQRSDLPLATLDTMLVLPFPVWGPLLVLAAVAYYRRRTAPVPTS